MNRQELATLLQSSPALGGVLAEAYQRDHEDRQAIRDGGRPMFHEPVLTFNDFSSASRNPVPDAELLETWRLQQAGLLHMSRFFDAQHVLRWRFYISDAGRRTFEHYHDLFTPYKKPHHTYDLPLVS